MGMAVTVGIDEAGRGCWAGPLVAAAVVLHVPVKGLADSKKLSKNQREILAERIVQHATYGIGWVSAKEIDDVGLTLATQQAMTAALKQIENNYDEIIIDGNLNYLPGIAKVKVLPKADSLIPAVSAASIIAKVARDRYMYDIAAKYPQYKFERHVGYGTALHHEMLKIHGACDLHRISYKPLQVLLRVADV
jgi:ribonuclease HII